MSLPPLPDAPYTFTSPSPEPTPPVPSNPGPGRPRGTGAKRGRKPRGAALSGVASPRIPSTDTSNATATSPYTPHVHWDLSNTTSTPGASGSSSILPPSGISGSTSYASSLQTGLSSTAGLTTAAGASASMNNLFRLSEGLAAAGALPRIPGLGADDEGEGDDELLPAMADDDYSAQLSWQSQSKDNLKVLMENFSPDQYERFEAYRRHALPKQAVRKVIQQMTGQQVSQPVAQIVAGFGKVFVGEIIEKARQVQARRGESGPLSPDHLREAYRLYQQETGNVGAAKPVRAKKLFVR